VRRYLEEGESGSGRSFRLRRESFRGKGLRPGLREGDWPAIHEFLAICTHPRIYDPATPWRQAVEKVNAWPESPTVTLHSEQPGYWETLVEVGTRGRLQGPEIHDARIAALWLQHGVAELWSADRDFSRMQGLRVRNPLSEGRGRR
jgi:hypothetical protein